MGPSMPAPVGAFSPPVLSPAELPCHPCLSPLACSPRLPASSTFPVLITSHNDVTLMSPRCTPTPDLDAAGGHAPWPWFLPGLCTAGACCELLQARPRVLLSVCRLPRCVSADSHPCNERAGLSSAPFGRCSQLVPSLHPWGHASPRALGQAGLSIATVGCGGAASPPLEFQCVVAEHPSLPASARAPGGAA